MSQYSRTQSAVIVGSMMTTDRIESLVHVRWLDAHSVGTGWQSVDEIEDVPCVVCSVGYLISGAKTGHVVIAQSVTDDAMLDHLLAIPVAMITQVTVLSDSSVGSVFPFPTD
jgi:hypothetical protein